jgi:hypothetical protein
VRLEKKKRNQGKGKKRKGGKAKASPPFGVLPGRDTFSIEEAFDCSPACG